MAVYDGHHGHFAADMASTELHHALLMELVKFDPSTKITDSEESVSENDSRAQSGRYSSVSMRSRESTVMLEQIIKNAREDEIKMKQSKNAKNLTVQNDTMPPSDENEKKTKTGKNPFHGENGLCFQEST